MVSEFAISTYLYDVSSIIGIINTEHQPFYPTHLHCPSLDQPSYDLPGVPHRLSGVDEVAQLSRASVALTDQQSHFSTTTSVRVEDLDAEARPAGSSAGSASASVQSATTASHACEDDAVAPGDALCD